MQRFYEPFATAVQAGRELSHFVNERVAHCPRIQEDIPVNWLANPCALNYDGYHRGGAIVSVKILLTADIHIGLTSSRAARDRHGTAFRTSEAWLRIVQLAIEEDVSVVCLAGDIVDQNNKFFEAIGPLQQGIERLTDAGITTVAVSGNHDHDVLARLAAQFSSDHFRLLGKDGDWERTAIEQDGQVVLHIDGVCFPSQIVKTSPLDSYEVDTGESAPTLGLIHGDIHDTNSRYRPLDLQQLQGIPVDGWLLGHIHAEELIERQGSPWVLYPGSPQALDPGETGSHGPWITIVEGASLTQPVQRPTSTASYDSVSVDLSTVETEEDMHGTIVQQLREHATDIIDRRGPDMQVLLLRVRLTGTTSVFEEIDDTADQLMKELSLQIEGVSVEVDSYINEAAPPIKLEEYVGMNSAPGALSRLLLELDEPEVSDEAARLIQSVRKEIERTAKQREFDPLEPETVSDETARGHLRSEARALLSKLVTEEL